MITCVWVKLYFFNRRQIVEIMVLITDQLACSAIPLRGTGILSAFKHLLFVDYCGANYNKHENHERVNFESDN